MNPITKSITVLTTTLLLLAACETTEGFGRDTQKLGNNISSSAEKLDGNAHDDAGGTR